MQNCCAIQTLPLQCCSWEMFSNRECSLESSKASFINQLNPVSSSLQLQRCSDRDGWETGALSEITPQLSKTQQRGPLQWGAPPRSASRKGKGWALSHPNSPWASAPCQQDRICCHLTVNNTVVMPLCQQQRGQFPFYLPLWGCENGKAEWTRVSPTFWKPGSPLGAHQATAMKGRSPPAQRAHSCFGEGSTPRAEDLVCLNPPQNLLCVNMMLKSKESSGTLQRNKEQAAPFFISDDLILYDKTVQRTFFLLYWKNYKQKGISKKELEEKEKEFSACKCFIRTVNPAGHIKHLSLELESWVECIWTICEGTQWKQIPPPCLQQPYQS